MPELKSYTCPNCGANTTDARNCEFCGSLLVRFVEKGIDLSQTTYLADTETFPGLINALKQNLQLQESTNESIVTTDIVGPVKWNDVGRDYIGCILRNGNITFADGTPAPSKSKKGLCVTFNYSTYVDSGQENFNQIQQAYRKRFQSLDCYPLFMEHICYYTWNVDGEKRKGHEYFIDFGEDAEGAARLLSKIWKEVYEIPLDANVEYYNNVGENNVVMTRKAIHEELFGNNDDDEEYDDEEDCADENNNRTYPNWYYWVGAFVLFALFKMCS